MSAGFVMLTNNELLNERGEFFAARIAELQQTLPSGNAELLNIL